MPVIRIKKDKVKKCAKCREPFQLMFINNCSMCITCSLECCPIKAEQLIGQRIPCRKY